jgi:hypothetical protein
MRFEFQEERSWPPLAWHAQIEPTASTVLVTHGARVETHDNWFCEGVWDGRFDEGAFVQSENFFGSAGKIEDGTLRFVASCAPLDRLHYATVGGSWHVSNSLPCLLAQMQADIDPTYQKFGEETLSIAQGIDGYNQTLETSQGTVSMSICRDLVWKINILIKVDKCFPPRRFPTFKDYESFLLVSLANIASNMRSGTRKNPYLNFVSGISSGYDSPTVCALVRKAGLREAFTFTKARGGLQEDDGTAVGERLGLRVYKIDRYLWKKKKSPEIPFMAAFGSFHGGLELAGVEDFLRNRVFLTGTIGDGVWAVDSSVERVSRYKRTDNHGLEMSEFRLRVGYIHLPVPCIGYSGLEDVIRLSQSEEMKPWDHSNTPYENYSRPICRRILEEAGVPRTAFAFEKRVATHDEIETNITAASLRSMYQFNKSNEMEWKRVGVTKVVPSWMDRIYFSTIAGATSTLLWLGKKKFRGSSRIRTLGLRVRGYKKYELSFNRGFAWAIHEAKKAYTRQLQL